MRGRFLLAFAAGAFLTLGGTAHAQFSDSRYDRSRYGYDSRCIERIQELERNVAKYERHGRWADARKERAKLNEARRNCRDDRRTYYRDGRCAERIRELERNVARYERQGRWGDARREREKLFDTRRSCGFDERGYWHWHDRDGRWDRDRDRRDWRRNPR
jgi:chromosome segregation ATPase